jgi:hypothetical protein
VPLFQAILQKAINHSSISVSIFLLYLEQIH